MSTPVFMGSGIFILYIILSGIYYALRINRKPMIWSLGLIHLLGTTSSVLGFLILAFRPIYHSVPRREMSFQDYSAKINLCNNMEKAAFYIFIISIIFFLINILLTLSKSARQLNAV